MAHSVLLLKQWEWFEEQEYRRALEETQKVLPQLKGDDLKDAQRLLGLCCQHEGQYSQASHWFKMVCQGSAESGDWLNQAVAAARQHHLAEAQEAFEQARLCQQAAKYTQEPGLYLQIYWYALALGEAGAWEQVQPLLDELARVYVRLHNTDAVQLYRHSVPFLGSALILATHHFRARQQYAEGIIWLQHLAEDLDEAGQRQVSRAMTELRQADEGVEGAPET